MIYLWETHAAFCFIVCLPSRLINFSSKYCSSLACYLACEEHVSDGMDRFLFLMKGTLFSILSPCKGVLLNHHTLHVQHWLTLISWFTP